MKKKSKKSIKRQVKKAVRKVKAKAKRKTNKKRVQLPGMDHPARLTKRQIIKRLA
jgi:hypothetical protein